MNPRDGLWSMDPCLHAWRCPAWFAWLFAALLCVHCAPAAATIEIWVKHTDGSHSAMGCANWDDFLATLQTLRSVQPLTGNSLAYVTADDKEAAWLESDEHLDRLLNCGVTYNLVRPGQPFTDALRGQLFVRYMRRHADTLPNTTMERLVGDALLQHPHLVAPMMAGYRAAKAAGPRPGPSTSVTNGLDFGLSALIPRMFSGAWALLARPGIDALPSDIRPTAPDPLAEPVRIDGPVDPALLHPIDHFMAPRPQAGLWQAGVDLYERMQGLPPTRWPGTGDPFAESQYGAPRVVLWTPPPRVAMPWWKRPVTFVLRTLRP